MTDGIFFKLTGADEAIRLLKDFGADMKRKTVLQALRAAARPFVRAARAVRPPRDFSSKRRVAGTLRRNIKSFTSKKYRGANGVIGVYVTVKASKRDLKNAPVTGDPFYYRFVEGGHKIVARRSKRDRRTISARRRVSSDRVKAYPFLGTAAKSQGSAALKAFGVEIQKRVDKANAAK